MYACRVSCMQPYTTCLSVQWMLCVSVCVRCLERELCAICRYCTGPPILSSCMWMVSRNTALLFSCVCVCPTFTSPHTHAHTEPIEWDLNFVPLYVAKEGDQLPVSCRATGVPSPRVTYRNQGSNHEKNELFFAAVHLGDNRTYSCRACHEVFDNSRGVLKTNCLTRNFQVFVIAKRKD